MNYYNLKRTSTDDINQNRKRRRTISNDMFRGMSLFFTLFNVALHFTN